MIVKGCSCASYAMLNQSRFVKELLITALAIEFFTVHFWNMDISMLFKICRSGESLRTFRAFEWLFTSVDLLVPLQV
jgi:hypothetical protein